MTDTPALVETSTGPGPSRYPLGQIIRLLFTCAALNIDGTTGALTDASTTTTGTYSTPTHDSAGTYHQDVPAADLATIGHYQYKVAVSGGVAGVGYGSFDVSAPYEVRVIALQDAKLMLNIPATDLTHDAELLDWIASI